MIQIRTIDNFLHQKDFNELNSLQLENVLPTSIKIYHNEIDKNNNVKKSSISRDLIKNLHNNYHKKAMEILKSLNKEKASLYEYSDFSIIKTGKNSTFPIHDDTPNKLLSGVIYLYPNKNTGTIFYSDKNGKLPKIINWKQNTGVFFSRIERTSWHSYQGDGKSDRVALVYNLMTTKIKEVYRIEKKNYFYGLLRWKLNPHLYNYLKIFI